MPTPNGRRPFTEMIEVCQRELVREAAEGEDPKYKGFINQSYTNELPSVLPERFIKRDGFVTTVADYTTGTVKVGTGTANVIGSSTAWNSANSDDLNLKVSGDDRIYRMTFDAGTSLTFQNSLTWVGDSGTGLSYIIFQDRYALPSNFAYMIQDAEEDPNVVYVIQNGSKIYLTPWTNDEFNRHFNNQVQNPPSHYTVKWDSTDNPFLHIWPATDLVDIVGFEFIPNLASMRELTTGTAALSGASGTALVLTSDASMTASLDTARTLYFRNDVDGTGSGSKWAQIASVADSSTATLNSANSPAVTSGTGLTYSISEISQWPVRFDDSMMYRAAWLVDPDNVQGPKWQTVFSEAVGFDRATETKRRRSTELKFFSGKRHNER